MTSLIGISGTRCTGIVVAAILTCGLAAQTQAPLTRDDEQHWSELTGLPVLTIHGMWRMTSHFADEADDDSRIVLVNVRALSSRNQILMVTAAGIPTCLTATVFSNAGSLKLWSVDQTPDGEGFCERMGLEPEVRVDKGAIFIRAPGDLLSEHSNHAGVAEYVYTWTGSTYRLGQKTTSLETVPAAQRPVKRPQ